jgi:tRNA (guanine-N7-)-methyltransferase
MTKKKIQRFAEMETFPHVIQPVFEDVFGKDHYLKGFWHREFFRNSNPIVLELGCGKGEYTTSLAALYRNRNFIGIDIKGSRMWRGARTALSENLNNTAFLRTRIEMIGSFFAPDEVEEIWITFPDPQLKKKRKRLTSARFLNNYARFLKNGGRVHLKTDSAELFQYTLELARYNGLNIIFQTDDLYNSSCPGEIVAIQTFYERQFLDQGMTIKYLSFELSYEKTLEEPPAEDQP